MLCGGGRFRLLAPLNWVMAGRPRKSLLQRCYEGGFRVAAHHRLLGSDPEVPWPELAGLQQRYRRAGSLSEQLWIAGEFRDLLLGKGGAAPALRSEALPA